MYLFICGVDLDKGGYREKFIIEEEKKSLLGYFVWNEKKKNVFNKRGKIIFVFFKLIIGFLSEVELGFFFVVEGFRWYMLFVKDIVKVYRILEMFFLLVSLK